MYEYRAVQNIAKRFAVCNKEAQINKYTLKGPYEWQEAPFVIYDANI